jgi:hypothetical protein
MKRQKTVVKAGPDLPEYTHFLPRRSKAGGHVTSELVAKLLGDDSADEDTGTARGAPLGPLDPRLRGDDEQG